MIRMEKQKFLDEDKTNITTLFGHFNLFVCLRIMNPQQRYGENHPVILKPIVTEYCCITYRPNMDIHRHRDSSEHTGIVQNILGSMILW